MSLSLPPAASHESGQPVSAAPSGPGAFALAWAGARRRWFLAGLTGVVLGGGGAVAYYTQTPQKYTVTTTLQITPRNSLLDDHETGKADVDYRRTQSALIRSRPVVQKVVENKKIADSSLLRDQPDPAGWLETELKAVPLEGGLIRVSLTGEKPEELAATLNAVTDAYLEKVVDAEEFQRRTRVDELDKVLASSEDRVRKQRNDLRALAETLRTSDTQSLNLRQQLTLQQYSGLQREILGLESQLRSAKSQLEVEKSRHEAAKNQPIPENTIAEALAADPAVRAGTDDVARYKSLLAGSDGTVLPGSPAHERMTGDVKAAEERLAATKAQRKGPVLELLRETLVRKYAGALAEAEAHVRVLEHQRTGLKPEVEAAKQEAEKIGLGSYELETKRAEMAEADAIVRKLRSEKERLAIEIQTYKRRVNVSSKAEAGAARPAASAITVAAGLGGAGFALGFLGVGYLDSRRRRLIHSHDVVQVMKLRALGNLPLVPGLEDEPITGVWDHRFGVAGSLLIEAISDLRAMVLAATHGRTPQVVMVTSAGQGEGKTTSACLLALSMAQVGKRTLLIDADLRNPQVAARLGLPPAAGLGEVLRGEARPTGVLGGVPGTPLAVMTAGRPCTTIIRGLSAERVAQVLTELRTQFDYIIVDSCPTPLADGLVIGACVDAALLVVRSGQSEETVVREACERMLAARVPLIGGVVNGLPLGRRWLRYPYLGLPQTQTEADAPAQVAGAV